MNPFMISFVVLGLIYSGILVWALAAKLTGSIVISVIGILVCAMGWKYSNDHLQ